MSVLRERNEKTPSKRKRAGSQSIADDASPEKLSTVTGSPSTPCSKVTREMKNLTFSFNRGDSNMEEEDENFPRRTRSTTRVRPNVSRNLDATQYDDKTETEADHRITRSNSCSRQSSSRNITASTCISTEASRLIQSNRRSHLSNNKNESQCTSLSERFLEKETVIKLNEQYPVKNVTLRLKRAGDDIRVSHSPFLRTPARILPSANIRGKQRMLNIDPSSDSSSCSDEDSDDCEERSARTPARTVKSTKTAESFQQHRPSGKRPKTLEEMRNLLHTSEVPERMPCREDECKKVKQFVLTAVAKNAKSHAMYISGVPGTGKTATTKNVVEDVAKGGNRFTYVYVNAMELMDPKQLFVVIYKAVSGDSRSISAVNARRKLNAMFEVVDRKRLPVLVLVDELDMLCTKRQEIIYDIFNWVVQEDARVSVIAIANTLDLPERMLCQRITSRLGANRIIFQPYTFDQIEKIIGDRLSGAPDLINHDAIQLAARRVASVSGDLRKAMDILRRSIEIAIANKADKLTIEHVNEAHKEASSTVRVAMVVALPQHSFMLFRAAVAQVESSGLEEFAFIDMYKQYRIMWTNLEGTAPYQEYGCYSMIMRMCCNRLLVAAPGTNCMRRIIRLGMTVQEAQFAIKTALDRVKEVPNFVYPD